MKATDLTLPVLGGTRVLVVDPGEDAAATLTAVLRLNGFETKAAKSAAESLAVVRYFSPRAVVLDPDLPDADWRKLVRQMSRLNDPLAVIVLTGDTSANSRQAALEFGAAHLLKPADPKELVKLLQKLCATQAA